MTGRRVLLINYEYPPLGGGAGTATRGIARGLTRAGHEVVVFTSAFKGLPAREQQDGFTVVRVPVRRRRVDRANPIEMLSFCSARRCGSASLQRNGNRMSASRFSLFRRVR